MCVCVCVERERERERESERLIHSLLMKDIDQYTKGTGWRKKGCYIHRKKVSTFTLSTPSPPPPLPPRHHLHLVRPSIPFTQSSMKWFRHCVWVLKTLKRGNVSRDETERNVFDVSVLVFYVCVGIGFVN